MRSWAQFGEDLTIARLLGDHWFNRGDGFYCDVGAWSDHVHSVSRMYYDMGWQGVSIEPVSFYFNQLVATRPRDINLHCAVGEYPEAERKIHVIAGTGLSTLVDGFDPGPYQDFYETVQVRSLDEICDTHPCPPDRFFGWLKIDVEGFEIPVIRGADFGRYRPRVLCVEADHGDYREWESIIVRHEYRFVEADKANRFFVRKEDG
jgi:FkbM family methyltransferase